jgi:hypothetical protein
MRVKRFNGRAGRIRARGSAAGVRRGGHMTGQFESRHRLLEQLRDVGRELARQLERMRGEAGERARRVDGAGGERDDKGSA